MAEPSLKSLLAPAWWAHVVANQAVLWSGTVTSNAAKGLWTSELDLGTMPLETITCNIPENFALRNKNFKGAQTMKCKLWTETLEFSRLKVPNSRFALHGLAPP